MNLKRKLLRNSRLCLIIDKETTGNKSIFGIASEIKASGITCIIQLRDKISKKADILKSDWSKIGVKLNISVRSADEINSQVIQTRNYEMLLFGNIFSNYDSPDLSSFWHSSERFYPGLNLALYQNSAADNLIQAIRTDFNDSRRQIELSGLASLIISDQPAIFLFSPNYLYVSGSQLMGFDGKFIASAGDRFKNIQNWSVQMARVFE